MKIHRTYIVQEGPTGGMYAISLFDRKGNRMHTSRGSSRYFALLGLVSMGFDIEWEPGETPEPQTTER